MRPLDEKETSTVFDPSYEITLSSVPPLKLLIRFLWVAIFCFEEWLFQGKGSPRSCNDGREVHALKMAMMAVKDIHRCWCFEEAFSHPWRETICLSLRGIWKGGDFVTYRCAKLRNFWIAHS
ncbi:hypothetical protein GLYMA_17G025650v4 [Glycine max]|nr:hypothetical protein GLYMA_17G025650v4 [Glycine max]KAH1116421.1 hypothetical protein GYH30_046031 [Glycine max]